METRAIDSIIKDNLSPEQLKEFNRIYYGREDHCELSLKESTTLACNEDGFEVAAYSIPAAKEETRPPRLVKLGLVQHSIVLLTDQPIKLQRDAIFRKIEKFVQTAAKEGVQILCLEETWSMPFFLGTREKDRWSEFAESAENGPSVSFLSKLAMKHGMVIISPILERESSSVWWNTAVVIDENGKVMGKHRKNHLPSVGSFSETSFYSPGNTGHPVFETKFGKIAINICYGRHQALNWLMFALNGAEIVFNPAATISEFGESFWGIEARNAAVANSYFTCSINRVGTEEFSLQNGIDKIIRTYYGSSYITAPNGCRTPSLSRTRDGLLIAEVDLNLCRQSILAYNGGAVVAMKGQDCVAIATDKRFGIQAQTVSTNFPKVYRMGPSLYVGLPGLATDTQTVFQRLQFRMNLYELKENRVMSPKTFSAMLSNLLYERRFGPYFIEPVIAGLDPYTSKPYVCNMDVIGCPNEPEDFAVSGTCAEQLYGMCEALWEPNLKPDELFETISQALVNAADRDAISGWGAVVYIIEKDKITEKHVKTRMD
ncbi:hypothetical protein MSG28_012201 [Choristoneura fumiferana]|uniref:Uncharacterized protein n=1 Tax=Choristoneura fumiferana TaxID=7141 RepID=A0ACC0KC11_CHOFU|nr:hypothetical protein MSG28_012201 [Choristoneura fumiferana]